MEILFPNSIALAVSLPKLGSSYKNKSNDYI
jgi:hypothetical protein